nr:hypothetical protein BaRGS_007394 [Batillaria attramentaria]
MLCVKTGIPGVNNAVQKLEELAGRMISGHFGFRTNDVDNIDMVIDALYQLESERKKMHESLETESITAFRYQSGMSDVIARTEGEIWGSLTDVLQTTRAANARKRQEVEETLARKLENLAELEDSSLELDEENALLRSEYEMLQTRHKELLEMMNQTKYEATEEMSILSELKREERDVHEHMMEQEENIICIQNEMIQARQTARQEKAAMLQEIEVLKEEAEQQPKQNRVEKRKLEAMKAQLANSYSQLQDMKRSMAELEQRQVALEKEEKTKEAYFTRVHHKSDRLQTKGLTLVQEALDKATDEIARMETENIEMEDEIFSTADCHTYELMKEAAAGKNIQKQKLQLIEESKAKMIQQERTMVENKDTKAYFAHTKEQEAFVDDDTDPMWWGVDKDTLDELKELQQLEDSKPAGLAQTVAGVDMIMGMRPAETKEFMKITKLPVAARPSKSEVAHTKTRKPAVKKVKRAKSQEPAKVTQPIVKPTDSQEEALRMVTLAQAEREECKMLEATVEAKRQELKEKLPFVQELQKRFEELTTGFLEIQVAPEKVKGLQAEITKVKAELAEAREPLAFLREENKAKRASYLHQLENNGDVIKTKEKAIFSVTCKIRAIMEANEKFENDFVLKSEATAAEFDRFKIDEAEMEAKAKILDPIVDALQSESAILKDHLRRLLPRPPSAGRMTSGKFGFRTNDVDNINVVIDALYQLATRAANARQRSELEQTLARKKENVAELEKNALEFETENALLMSEYEMLRKRHNKGIEMMNQQMHEKARLDRSKDAVNKETEEIATTKRKSIEMETELYKTEVCHIRFLPLEARKARRSLHELIVEEGLILGLKRKSIEMDQRRYSDLSDEESRLLQEIADADERIRRLKAELRDAQHCPEVDDLENTIRNMLVSYELMQEAISEKLIQGRQLQLIGDAKTKLIQKERAMVEDKDHEAYFEHKQKQDECVDEHTDPMWRNVRCWKQRWRPKRRELMEKLPIFKELQKRFEERTARYEEMEGSADIRWFESKEIIFLDNIEKASLREKLKEKRAAYQRQLELSGQVTKAKEQAILSVTCKIRALLEANEKFVNRLKILENDLKDVQIRTDENTELTEKILPAKLANLKVLACL